MKKRVGRFSINSQEIYVNPGEIQGIMQHCIIVRAEQMFDTKAIDYLALSLKFEEIEFGCVTPDYEWSFDGVEWIATRVK